MCCAIRYASPSWEIVPKDTNRIDYELAIDLLSDYLDKWENISFEDKRKATDGLISSISTTNEYVKIGWKIWLFYSAYLKHFFILFVAPCTLMFILPYNELSLFCRKITSESYLVVWKNLSIDNSHKQPQLIFKCFKNLHAALTDSTIRRKLVHFLRDEFRWSRSDRIEFYDDFVPHSFVFKEFRDGQPTMTGGLILHNQDDMQKASYSIHT